MCKSNLVQALVTKLGIIVHCALTKGIRAVYWPAKVHHASFHTGGTYVHMQKHHIIIFKGGNFAGFHKAASSTYWRNAMSEVKLKGVVNEKDGNKMGK